MMLPLATSRAGTGRARRPDALAWNAQLAWRVSTRAYSARRVAVLVEQDVLAAGDRQVLARRATR